ncbi:PREDICTED: bcl-2-related ovarian killer protein homolog B-like [Branchiostoma belcheri]|uniref:Bcl-2-related ovarian killer protein homolog B-like n=1 Tax=Branchiostoma belcheri TaxID=7741 RepID=A0A6P4ZYY2_BRABE|nr:PREDICTED: bcl-2-related ovarian killer protein homolog B-like [Branchiostoma belcheri]
MDLTRRESAVEQPLPSLDEEHEHDSDGEGPESVDSRREEETGGVPARVWTFLREFSVRDWLRNAKDAALDLRQYVLDVPETIKGSLWSQAAPTEKSVIDESRQLIRDYINGRLKKSNLTRGRLPDAKRRPTEVSSQLQKMGGELERMYPHLYRDVSRQINITLSSESILETSFETVANELFSTGITWARIVAMFAVAGAFAVDCVHQGHPMFTRRLVDVVVDFTDRKLSAWLVQEGGWYGLVKHFRGDGRTHMFWAISGIGAAIGLAATFFVIDP